MIFPEKVHTKKYLKCPPPLYNKADRNSPVKLQQNYFTSVKWNEWEVHMPTNNNNNILINMIDQYSYVFCRMLDCMEYWLLLHLVISMNWYSHNSQFERAFSASTRCLCVFILPAGRHAMLLQWANMYVRTGHSNIIYNMKYNVFGLGSLRNSQCIYANVNHYKPHSYQ